MRLHILARVELYRQTLGRLHQWFVSIADEAYEINYGVVKEMEIINDALKIKEKAILPAMFCLFYHITGIWISWVPQWRR